MESYELWLLKINLWPIASGRRIAVRLKNFFLVKETCKVSSQFQEINKKKVNTQKIGHISHLPAAQLSPNNKILALYAKKQLITLRLIIC